jgi:hypothetical protein
LFSLSLSLSLSLIWLKWWMYRHITFLCGRGGLYALGAVAASYKGDRRRRDFFVNLFLEVPSNISIFISINIIPNILCHIYIYSSIISCLPRRKQI